MENSIKEFQKTHEARKKDRQNNRRAVQVMLTMLGLNVLTPSPIADPYISKVADDPSTGDLFNDLIITMERTDPSKRKELIRAIAVKYLEQIDLLDLGMELSDINTEVMAYGAEHEEVRKDKDEAFKDFLSLVRNSGENPAEMGII